jgi:hypothetical protein
MKKAVTNKTIAITMGIVTLRLRLFASIVALSH